MAVDRPPVRERVGDLGIEVVAIVLSVLLALALNEWRQGIAERKLVDRVLTTVRTEAVRNRDEVARAVEHHESLVRELRQGGLVRLEIDLAEHRIDPQSAEALERSLRRVLPALGVEIAPGFEVERRGDRYYARAEEGGEIYLEIDGGTLRVRAVGGIQLRSPDLLSSAWETAQATEAVVHMEYELVALMAEIHDGEVRVRDASGTLLEMLYGVNPGDELPALEDLVAFERRLLSGYERLLERIGGAEAG